MPRRTVRRPCAGWPRTTMMPPFSPLLSIPSSRLPRAQPADPRANGGTHRVSVRATAQDASANNHDPQMLKSAQERSHSGRRPYRKSHGALTNR
jgi:hypothetical protein